MSKLAEMGINESLWKELMQETLQEHQKDMSKVGRQQLKQEIKARKEWNKEYDTLKKTNNDAVKQMEKGFQELNKVTQEGLEETGEEFEKLANSAKIAKPAVNILKQSILSQTMGDQLDLMQSLLEVSQSEGVQGIVKLLAKMFNGLLTNGTQITKFATDLSNLLGNTLTQNVDFESISKGMKSLNEVKTSMFESLAGIISQMITKIAEYPSVFQVFLDVTNILIGVLKGLEQNLLELNNAIEAVNDWIERVASKWGIDLKPEYIGVGLTYDELEYDSSLDGVVIHEYTDENNNGIPDYEEDIQIKPDLGNINLTAPPEDEQ